MITYTRDDRLRRIDVRASGSFDADEIIEVINRQRREGTSHYALSFDGRMLRGEASFEDLERIRAADTADSEPRGPVAVVYTDLALYRKACAYSMLLAKQRRVEVFESRSDAEQWLHDQGF